jgi:hypothetical protein
VNVYRNRAAPLRSPIVELYGGRARACVWLAGARPGRALAATPISKELTSRTSPFDVRHALTLKAFQEAAGQGTWEDLLQPVDFVLESWYAALLAEDHSRAVRQGRVVELEPASQEFENLPSDTNCRAYSASGDFLAVLKYVGKGLWKPEKVFLPL